MPLTLHIIDAYLASHPWTIGLVVGLFIFRLL